MTDPARPPAPHTILPDLPSGRPRRLLLAVHSLQPGESARRALDVARHLARDHRWVVRLLCSETGPLRDDCLRAGLDVQRVDGQPPAHAPAPAAAASTLATLQRQVWWRHLDAVAVFDPECHWVIAAARAHGLPVLFDCSTTRPLPAWLEWRSATQVCFASRSAAAAQAAVLGGARAEIIPPWHDAAPPPGGPPGAACVNSHPQDPPLRDLLNAAAAGVPVISVAAPAVSEFFRPHEILLVPPGLPLALEHARRDLAANPAAAARRVDFARRGAAARHAPAPLLARWQALLEGLVAARG